jgi:hypothetical protein
MTPSFILRVARIGLVSILATLSGCGPSEVRAPDSDIESAKALLSRSLEQWKAGKTAEEFRALAPPIYFLDEAMKSGAKLKDFRILSNGEMYVSNVKFEVELQFEGSVGEEGRQRSIQYLVTTVPQQTIGRLE